MYRLTYFKSRYVIGFLSGTGSKTFELDLTKFSDKDILVIFGDNASGKSTFLSLVHPWHTPSDGRTKFIVPDKEGYIYREYTSDDGTIISTKCIYKPKSDGGHTPKCYFEVKKPGEDAIELNPNGNVSSYTSLLYTYFGINKEFLNFATYNNAVSGIIRMTDQERKNSVSTMVPNMGRFEFAYATINDKYKELRSLIRNVSQKLLQYRDEESIRTDLRRISKELDAYSEQREERVKKTAKIEGRLKELSKGEDIEDLITEYHNGERSIELYNTTCKRIMLELHRLYDKLGIEYESDSIIFRGMDSISSKIIKLEKNYATALAEQKSYQENQARYLNERSAIDDQILELESALYGIETQDPEELETLRKSYLEELEDLHLNQELIQQYSDMNYDGVIAFSNSVAYVLQMIQSMYDEYGNLVTEYFEDLHRKGYEEEQVASINKLRARIETNSAKKDFIYRKLIEMEQYRKFQAILDQRPKSCTIDSCPFIANALKWESMSDEVEKLKKQFAELDIEIVSDNNAVQDHSNRIGMYNAAQTMISYLCSLEESIKIYFHVSMDEVYQSIAKGTWSDIFDILALKDLASKISARDRYLKIKTELLPETDRMLKMIHMYAASRNAINAQIAQLKTQRKELKKQAAMNDIHMVSTGKMLTTWEQKIHDWNQISELVDQYNDAARKILELAEVISKSESTISQIQELKEKKKQLKHEISELDDLIRERQPLRQQLNLDLISIDRLHLEKLSIEQDFLVVDVIRSIMQPGKGLRKELINIYMFDIYQTANQLLLNTFNGNLYLKEFIITDKEFIIPYVYNGTVSPDIAFASASQQSAISISISMAILSKIMGNYGIACFDEADGPFSPANREIFIDILTTQIRYIGLAQCFFITQHPNEYTENDSVGFIAFPGGNTKNIPKDDLIKIK